MLTFDERLARQLDTTMRECIVVLLQAGHRLKPEAIERLRGHVLDGFLESARIALREDEQRRREAQEVPGPWDDEITKPERPTNKPPRH